MLDLGQLCRLCVRLLIDHYVFRKEIQGTCLQFLHLFYLLAKSIPNHLLDLLNLNQLYCFYLFILLRKSDLDQRVYRQGRLYFLKFKIILFLGQWLTIKIRSPLRWSCFLYSSSFFVKLDKYYKYRLCNNIYYSTELIGSFPT